ncbi:hypothetical protein BCR34DRAFT_609684 [Clohesyomyces aquaticus]|uniref:Actin-like ATPase domain-containing protein n=1 Tax=Clohesyomyces aquaticus TaxID=1231657 RepID=A0A1Y2AAH5_9PLEO|nr:hypothetical protein BCR34DRAFT_609684 [Clohesyomyces aquaticus]
MSISEIVVGIDFGTTYSGVSWAVNGGNRKIRVISDWEEANSTRDKVPTVIHYRDGDTPCWGYEAAAQGRDSLNNFRWFKVLLDSKPRYAHIVSSVKDRLKRVHKSAQEVAADYLRLLWDYAKEEIRKGTGMDDWQEVYSLKVVVTVPAVWSPRAKERTKEAAKSAGLPDDLTLVVEPEAAALTVLKERADDGTLEVGEVFVVCDAGGGTVDLISYKVRSVQPLELEECAVGTGDLCGSIFVDTAFEKFIKVKVGDKQYDNIRERWKTKMLRDFDEKVKRNFSSDTKMSSIELRDVQDDAQQGIEDETILLHPNELRTVFDMVCGQVVNLVEKQIAEVAHNGLSVKTILLVGGFGANRYLYHRILSSCRTIDEKMTVIQLKDAWSAICRGACLWGLEHSSQGSQAPTVKTRLARYSYGICRDLPWDPKNKSFSEQDKKKDTAHGGLLAKDQMVWFIEKGDPIEEGMLYRTQISQTVKTGVFRAMTFRQNHFSQQLWYCSSNEPPTRQGPSVKRLCSVDFEIWTGWLLLHENAFKSPVTGKRTRDANFDLLIKLGSANIDFEIKWRDEIVGTCTADYKEDAS